VGVRIRRGTRAEVMTVLIGRDELVARLNQLIAERSSVLLVGPPGVGKSALIEGIARGVTVDVIDPFEDISRIHAARLRRRLDGGATMIGAACSLDRPQLGAVGRILWRFRVVRVPLLGRADLCRVIRRALAPEIRACPGAEAWIHELARASAGLAGRGCAFADAGTRYWMHHDVLPTPEWTVVEALTSGLPTVRSGPRLSRRASRQS
jgi:hypothetical protein